MDLYRIYFFASGFFPHRVLRVVRVECVPTVPVYCSPLSCRASVFPLSHRWTLDQVGAIMRKDATSIHRQVFSWTHTFIFSWVYTEAWDGWAIG